MAEMKLSDFGGYPSNSDGMMKSSNKLKHYSSDGHAGGIKDYPDTSEEIKRDQGHGSSHMERRKMKPGYRY